MLRGNGILATDIAVSFMRDDLPLTVSRIVFTTKTSYASISRNLLLLITIGEIVSMRVSTLFRSSAVMIATGLVAAVAATWPASAAPMTGAFPLCYQSKAMPGAVVMTLDLVVVTPKKSMSGQTTVTQAINPPLNVKLPVKGTYRDIRMRRHLAKLASPKRPGRHISIALTASSDWKTATATYSLWLDTPKPPKKGKLALHMVPCPK